MTENDFSSLKSGDIVVYRPGQPDKVWTIIGKPSWDQYSFLAILGRQKIAENHLWTKLLGASDRKREELAKRFKLTIIRLINPESWSKEHPAGTYSCMLCGTTTVRPHICPVFYPELRRKVF